MAWPAAVLLAGALLTGWVAGAIGDHLDAEARVDFELLTDRTAVEVRRRLNLPLAGLAGLRGLYAARDPVTLAEFRAYTESRDLPADMPGTQAFGYIERVAGADLERFVSSARADGLPWFTVSHDSGGREQFLVRFIEPLSQYAPALGHDMAAEPASRDALEKAVVSGSPTLAIGLPLALDHPQRPGFLAFMPVYASHNAQALDEDRWHALRGVLFAPIVADALLAGVGDSAADRLEVALYDGPAATAAAPLYGAVQRRDAPERRFESSRPILVGNRTFLLKTRSTARFEAAHDRTLVTLAAACGGLLTLLCASLTWQLLAGRARVERQVRELTADRDRLAKVVEHTTRTVLITDRQHRITWVNDGFVRTTGYSADEALGHNPVRLLGGEGTLPDAVARLRQSIRSGTECRAEVQFITKDGRTIWLDLERQPTFDSAGQLAGFMEIGTDITPLKQTECDLQQARDRARALASELKLLATVAQRTSNAVVVADAQRRVRWVNAGFERITGHVAATVVGRTLDGLLRHERGSGTSEVAEIQQALRNGQSWRGQLKRRTRGGLDIWLSAEIEPLHTEDGAPDGFIALGTDITDRVSATTALAQERSRLIHILEGTHAGDGEWNLQTGALNMSSRWAAMFGYRLDELDPISAETWVALCHPDDLGLLRQAFRSHLRSGADAFMVEARMRHRDGQWLSVELRGRISSWTPDGRPEWVSGTHIDVTQRRRAAQRWQARAELSSDWFWQTDSAHRLLPFDRSTRELAPDLTTLMTGRRRDEVASLSPPEGDADWGAFHARLDRRQRFRGVQYRAEVGPSQYRWFEIEGRPRFDEEGRFIGYQGVGRDVTERRRVTDELRSSLALIAALFEGIPVPVVLKDKALRYVRMNKAYAALFGTSAEDLIGRRASDVINAEAAAQHDAADRQLLAEPGTMTYELHQQLAGGSAFDTLVCKSTLLDAQGEVIGLIGTVVDIGVQKAAQRAMTEAKEAAEAANRAKSAFLATMSHEIRTPMNGVLGMAELLSLSRLDPAQTQAVQTIRSSAAALMGLIDDILDFSKIEAGRLELEQVPTALAPLVESAGDALAPLAADKQVALHVFVDPGLPTHLQVDPVRLRQLLNNLVGNAIKFSAGRTDCPGEVALRVVRAVPGPGDDEPGPGSLLISVSDNGIGMDAATIARLFQPFTQAEVSTTRRFGGTGLGLAICRRLVELMNGRIDVRSQPGQGTCFEVRLPLQPTTGGAEAAAGLPPDATQPLDLNGLDCVLVAHARLPVDDMCAWLQAAGATVHIESRLADAAVAATRLRAPVVLIQAEAAQGRSVLLERPGVELRHLLIGQGRRSTARVVAPQAATLDQLRHASLLRAVALLAGRQAAPLAPAPVAEQPFGGPTTLPSVEQARARGQLILVAEDDATNRIVIGRQLALLGHVAEIVPDGSSALSAWRQGGHGLLLTDLHMPGIDGYSLAEAIRGDEAGAPAAGRPRLPILALTANAIKGEAARARAAGIDDYLTKPVSLATLKAALLRWQPAPAGAAAPAAPATAVDIGVLHAMVGDDPQTVHELLTEYLQSAREQVAALRNAWRDGDLRDAGTIAHKLKSASRSIGAIELGELCAALERQRQGHDEGADGMRFDIDHFERVVTAVLAQIEAHLGVTSS